MVKVLTIREPYVSLIKKGIKTIETRSFKTNYRGEIYIHTSLAKLNKNIDNYNEIINLIDLNDLNYGNIVLKANIYDCIKMDKNFIDNIKKNYNEYISGYYKEGYYAWLLKDIKIIKSIPAKGKLGIWNMDI